MRLQSQQFVEGEFAAAFGAAGFGEAGEIVAAGGAGDDRAVGSGDSAGAFVGGFTPDEDGGDEPEEDGQDSADEGAETPIGSHLRNLCSENAGGESEGCGGGGGEIAAVDSPAVPFDAGFPEEKPIDGDEEPGGDVAGEEGSEFAIGIADANPERAKREFEHHDIKQAGQREHEDRKENSGDQARHG